VAEAFGAHALGEAFDEALADLAGGLGGDVAGSEAGAASCEDEGCGLGVSAKGGRDEGLLVGEGFGCGRLKAGLEEEFDDGGTGAVDLAALKTAVADGEDDGAGVGREGGGHRC